MGSAENCGGAWRRTEQQSHPCSHPVIIQSQRCPEVVSSNLDTLRAHSMREAGCRRILLMGLPILSSSHKAIKKLSGAIQSTSTQQSPCQAGPSDLFNVIPVPKRQFSHSCISMHLNLSGFLLCEVPCSLLLQAPGLNGQRTRYFMRQIL